MMDNEDTSRRLKSIEGHVRGIERMVDEDAYCIDVIRQIQAVQAALDKVSSIILDWLGREDSNLRMQEPKSCVLPLDDAP